MVFGESNLFSYLSAFYNHVTSWNVVTSMVILERESENKRPRAKKKIKVNELERSLKRESKEENERKKHSKTFNF